MTPTPIRLGVPVGSILEHVTGVVEDHIQHHVDAVLVRDPDQVLEVLRGAEFAASVLAFVALAGGQALSVDLLASGAGEGSASAGGRHAKRDQVLPPILRCVGRIVPASGAG